MHAQDRALRRIQDGRGHQAAVDAAVGDRERAAGHLVHAQLPVACLGGERADGQLDLREGHALGVAEHGHHQAAVGADGDGDVGVVVVLDLVAGDVRVDLREALQRAARGLHEEAHEAQAHAVVLLEALLVLGAEAHDLGHVALVERGEHRGRVLRVHQALGDALPDLRHLLAAHAARAAHHHGDLRRRRHGLDRVGDRLHRRGRALDVGHHDASGGAAAGHLGEVDALVGRHLLGQGRCLLAVGGSRRSRSRRCSRGCRSSRLRRRRCHHLAARRLRRCRVDGRDLRAHLLLGAGLHLDAQHARSGRAHLEGRLVALDVDQHLVGLHPVAVILVPLSEGHFRDRLAWARHHDVHHVILRARCAGAVRSRSSSWRPRRVPTRSPSPVPCRGA